MGKQKRIIGAAVLGLVILAAMLWFNVTDRDAHHSDSSRLIVSIDSLADNHSLVGEAVIDGVLLPLHNEAGTLRASGAPQALSMRLVDDRQRYYDIQVGRIITLSGLSPQTPVTITTDDGAILHRALPADWNGRMVIDTPPAPFTLAFSQSRHTYRIHFPHTIGGVS